MIQTQLAPAARRVLAGFGRFSPGQKAATICTVLALAVGGFLFSSWASKPSMAPLYSNLSGSDASAIVDKLNAGGTPYKLADGGQTILVPQDKVYDLRLTMSGAGLPAGKDTGYALLDKQGVTTSEFMQHIGYQRALEGELASTIGAIDGVQSATVHLAVPQKDVFTDDQQKPTASVLVATAPGHDLTADQVQAVVHLVSSSVVGLAPEEVTVADATGKVLSTGGAEGSTVDSAGSTRAQQTQAFEQRMNTSLQQMIDQVVGPRHAVVKITADLNYDRTDTKSQTYAADPKLPPLSQSKTSESYTGSGTPSGGVLGPDNIQVPTGTNTGTGKYAKSSQTQDNAVGVVTQTVQSAPGSVRRLSVAVLLDSNTAGSIDPTKVQELVSSAVGLDAKRGDTMAVTALPFDQTAAAEAKKALGDANKAEQRNAMLAMGKTIGAALAVLVLLLGAWRSSKRRRRAALTDEEREQLEEMQAALDGARLRALDRGGDAPALESASPRDPSDDDRELRHNELTALVERQPEEVAQLLRGWLADKKG
jgi:flagellar M-ring protein FliF